MCEDRNPADTFEDKYGLYKCVKQNLYYHDAASTYNITKSKKYNKMKCDSMKLKVSKTKDLTEWQACHDKDKITYTIDDCHLIHKVK
jgi:hypothetical protein